MKHNFNNDGYPPTHIWDTFLKSFTKIMNFCFGDWSPQPDVRKKWRYAEISLSVGYDARYKSAIPKYTITSSRYNCLGAELGAEFGGSYENIVDVLDYYGSLGWEVIGVRQSVGQTLVYTCKSDEPEKHPVEILTYTLKQEIKS